MSYNLFHTRQHIVPAQPTREYAGGAKDEFGDVLQLAAKQYIPHREGGKKNKVRTLTVVGAVGNGFPKEMFEPLWNDLIKLSYEANFVIDSIWIADMAHQGQSGRINDKTIGDDPSWFDYSRDILQMINWAWPRIHGSLLGVGHSVGATALVHLAAYHPRLFSNLILIEPIFGRSKEDKTLDCALEGTFYANSTLASPESWPSRAAAEAYFRKSPPTSSFEPRVFDRWMHFGIQAAHDDRLVKSGGAQTVELVTRKAQEVITYIRPLFNPQEAERDTETDARRLGLNLYPDFDSTSKTATKFYCPESSIILSRLPELRSRILYVFGGKSVMFPKQKRKYVLSITGVGVGGNGGQENNAVQEILIQKGGHLLLFEQTEKCAKAIASYLGQEMIVGGDAKAVHSVDTTTGRVTERWKREVQRQVVATRASKNKL